MVVDWKRDMSLIFPLQNVTVTKTKQKTPPTDFNLVFHILLAFPVIPLERNAALSFSSMLAMEQKGGLQQQSRDPHSPTPFSLQPLLKDTAERESLNNQTPSKVN